VCIYYQCRVCLPQQFLSSYLVTHIFASYSSIMGPTTLKRLIIVVFCFNLFVTNSPISDKI
jgi:hypothetical protein